ncbi:hypothetical protein H0H81_005473 [Sphagnurus paluster]|uniref:F-box domain-containing protein n=1 Tax=Sphagnurus paluster TaxID=117069 RepID=A0A9P7FU96_9AGAR|nr:hypothetical protein H0H81_005473 [Sphagnurus paluster]
MSVSSCEPRRSILRRRQPPPVTPLPPDLCRRIPPEVFHIIIEKISRFDVHTLRACSLVCRTWHPVSRFHLIPTLALGPTNIKSFLRLLDSPYATISRGVHHISIHGDSEAISHRRIPLRESRLFPVTVDHQQAPAPPSPPPLDQLLHRLVTFSALTSLSFSWLQGGLPAPAAAALTHGLPALTALEFRTCTFPSFSGFAHTLSALRGLQRLALADVTYDDPALPATHVPPPPRLRTLELYLAPIAHLCTWLGAYAAADGTGLVQLETVRLCSAFWDDGDALAIAWMLRRLGPRIRHLALPWHIPEAVDLSHNTELRTLRITHLWFRPPPPPDADAEKTVVEEYFTVRGIEKTLLQLSAPHIQSIDFRVLLVCELRDGELGLDWERMRTILARACFGALQALTFGLPRDDRKVRAVLRKIWPGGAQGVQGLPVKEEKRLSRRSARRIMVDEVRG